MKVAKNATKKEVDYLVKVNLNKIKELRKEKGLSQEDVAKMLGFKTVYPYHRKEGGQQSFTAEELMTLSQIYNVPYEKFFILQVAKNETNKREPA
ncbi:MAG: transcriptional regulator [Symbiobacterium thermophilum]|uniref:Transcriptional regulator n=1 Tax=Symbiobacterium thermophilum TaxID=2734 RepID=A0A953I9D7_SYMTR|nr:transcriptional regulator [Symbiobacterium thermophilum]